MWGGETPESAMAGCFSWYWRKRSAGEVIDLRFKPRVPTEELLELLWQKVAPRGPTYGLVVSEGNIATGEAGWAVVLRYVTGWQARVRGDWLGLRVGGGAPAGARQN